MIQVHNLSKSFQRRSVVQDLSFTAGDGCITGILGSNGAGKTTTLRMICGILQPDSGTVRIDGTIGALLDHTGTYQRLTVRENLAYFGRLRGMPSVELPHLIDRIIAVLGLAQIADRRTAGLSQGEHMKTALGRALLHDPRNLILDEPANGLDIPSIRSLRDLLKRLRDAGHCILLSSHLLEEVRQLCDDIVVIANGHLAAHGSAESLCRQTRTASLEDAFVNLTSQPEDAIC